MASAAGPVQLSCAGLSKKSRGTSNCAYVTEDVFAILTERTTMDLVSVPDETHAGVVCSVGQGIFVVLPGAKTAGTVELGSFQRISADLALRDDVTVEPIKQPSPCAHVGFQIAQVNRGTVNSEVEAEDLKGLLRLKFMNHVFQVGQQFVIIFANVLTLKVTVTDLEHLDADAVGLKAGAGGGAGAGVSGAGGGAGVMATSEATVGQFVRGTDVSFAKDKASSFKLTGASSSRGRTLLSSSFNFEALGIGGLDAEFQVIFRKAFVARTFPPNIVAEMGMKHVRGMLLYGPPGCGKTLIARSIGKALNAHPPKVVNGPEVLSKWVGGSEENIRKLFKEAEEEQAERGDDSDLHIIIFDEIDAICKTRGTASGSTGVNDSVVNQLLSKIDGVDALNNILLIGMTNRLDMIDSALMRPGRLEVHVEIGLPDEAGRQQILRIHTKAMRETNRIDKGVDLDGVAKHTKNFTGAEIEGLVRAAGQIAMMRQADVNNLGRLRDPKSVKVYQQDFDKALSETKPQFGVAEDELSAMYRGGIIPYGEPFTQLWSKLKANVQQVVNSKHTHNLSMLLHGASGSGKSAIAAKLASECNFPFVKRIGADTLIGKSDSARQSAIISAFDDAYKSPESLIILDDIERLLGFVRIGPHFANAVLQVLMTLCKRAPPKPGCKIVVIATTTEPTALAELGLATNSIFNLIVEVPTLTDVDHITNVINHAATESDEFDDDDIKQIADYLATSALDTLPIALLLRILDAAAQIDDSSTGFEKFVRCMGAYGLA